MEFLQALKNRRSIYNLGTNVNLSNEEIVIYIIIAGIRHRK